MNSSADRIEKCCGTCRRPFPVAKLVKRRGPRGGLWRCRSCEEIRRRIDAEIRERNAAHNQRPTP
jgi:hypothetical protein